MNELELTSEERSAIWEQHKDNEMTVQLDAIMQRMSAKFRAVTPEEDDRWTWENCTKRDMKALGWDDRSMRRIAPEWNCPEQAKVFSVLGRKCSGVGAVIALVGTRGVGKTTLAAEHTRMRIEALREWYQQPESSRQWPPPPRPGRYEKLGRLAVMFKPLYADFGSIEQSSLAGLLETWCSADLVVLDELHENEELKTSMRFLTDFVDRRYANRKDTILISNKDAATFRSEINHSIASRISEHGAIIPCNWKSWRTQR